METWAVPTLPSLPRDVLGDAPELSLYDASTGADEKTNPGATAGIYVCGITPYDATHVGHAATYVSCDLIIRAWREAGHLVEYVQNVTDVDDPLLQRARQTGADWAELAARETELFRVDMAALSVIPPDVYRGVVESMTLIVELIEELLAADAAYEIDGDVYFSVQADPAFGSLSNLSRDAMLELFAERGGDPDRQGKRDPLDCLLWQRQRSSDPAWETVLGTGRPGWHTECAAIALHHLGAGFDLQAGGSDLIFPHHEMSAAQAQVVRRGTPFAKSYAHVGMVGYQGHKMSKSRGNLVLVSDLRVAGVDPGAIRLTLLAHHYRSDWEWRDDELVSAQARLQRWEDAVRAGGPDARPVADAVRAAMADDLDAPRALAAIDAWAESSEAPVEGAAELIAAVVQASLGVDLLSRRRLGA
jgi:L-cysteine:1D-myo-inositol 2-amino-2-deoxy-alpha-D-glucopyranoside ligase